MKIINTLKKHKKYFFMLAICVLILSVNNTYAFADTASDALKNLNKGSGGVVDSAVSLKFSNIYQDLYGLISMIVLGILSIKTTISSVAFSNAGENVNEKAQLKSKILYHCLGLAFFASSSGFVKFALDSLNMF